MIRKMNNIIQGRLLVSKAGQAAAKAGQAALVLILITAAALIFLAATLNWGRVAQLKGLVTIAADQAGTLLASDVASYGESQKQTYLQNNNSKTEFGGVVEQVLMVLLFVVVIIIIIVISIFCPGAGLALLPFVIAAFVLAMVNLVLQLTIVQPGITSMWNKLQTNQPVVQQFLEGGISAASQGVVADQVKVADYFDWNGNGAFGGAPANDFVSRYALFYTDRLKMLNGTHHALAGVQFFYDQLDELVNGATCGQKQTDNYDHGIPVPQTCQDLGIMPFTNNSSPRVACGAVVSGVKNTCPEELPTAPGVAAVDCVTDAVTYNPLCQQKVPGGFQLSDQSVPSGSSGSAYSPYTDPCCQVATLPNPGGKPDPKPIRPSSCTSDAQCSMNNPYYPYNSSYLDIYDSNFQNYPDQVSFLAKYGRDQQLIPATPPPLPLKAVTPDVEPLTGTPVIQFPNGIYSFFWEMTGYSPRVDAIDPTSATAPLKATSPELHWCVGNASVTGSGTNPTTATIPAFTPPAGFSVLNQLTLPYKCTGKDCCVNYLPDAISSMSQATALTQITVGTTVSGATVTLTLSGGKTSGSAYVVQVNSPGKLTGKATESGGGFTNGSFYDDDGVLYSETPSSTSSPYTFTFTTTPPQPDTRHVYAQATDTSGVTVKSATQTVIFSAVPSVVITNPGSVTAGTTVNLSVSASETGGTISSVNITGGSACTGSAGVYSCPWTAPSSGTGASVTATVTDSYGFSQVSAPVSITIVPAASGAVITGSGKSQSNVISSSTRSSAGEPSSGAAAQTSQATHAGGGCSSPTLTVDATGTAATSFSSGASLTLTACFPSADTGITSVLFTYCQGTATACAASGATWETIGSANSSTIAGGNTYTYTPWAPPNGAYAVKATATYPGATTAPISNDTTDGTTTGTVNGPIDMVGDPTLSLKYNNSVNINPLNGISDPADPASDPCFGPNGCGGAASSTAPNSWSPGDNQFCSATWPYNGLTAAFVDGQCQWYNQVYHYTSKDTEPPNRPKVANMSLSTVDGLDSAMYTLADFLKFAASTLNKDPGTLSNYFNSFYPKAATWIAPACSTTDGYATGCDPTNGCATTCSLNPKNGDYSPNCDISKSSTNFCNQNENGRLLSLYNVNNPPTDNAPSVDVFSDWNTKVMTPWLSNVYTPANATSSTLWCVPAESALKSESPAEHAYITDNTAPLSCKDGPSCETSGGLCKDGSACSRWGDLSHVIACLNYNAGQNDSVSQSTINKYQSCLDSLVAMNTAGSCPTSATCSGIGDSLSGMNCLPPECQLSVLGQTTGGASSTAPSFVGDGSDCNPDSAGSFANWVNNNINYGPIYSYQKCLDDLTAATCKAADVVRDCSSDKLGRSMLYIGASSPYSKTAACNSTKFLSYVTDSLAMAKDQQSKFILRSDYLTDIYTRAKTMQSMFTQADIQLHNFFKPCNGCADGTACPSSGICSDNSPCGPPACPSGGTCSELNLCGDLSRCDYCVNGGAAAQLMHARQFPLPEESLPNAIIYGWVDKTLPNGRTLPVTCADKSQCSSSGKCADGTACGGGTGYAHIIKVSAYSPGRAGNQSNGENYVPFLQSLLPWIQTSSGWDTRTYKLVQRDGYVYVTVKRWDQEHSSSVLFPNNHQLWKFSFNSPNPRWSSRDNTGGMPYSCSGYLSPNRVAFGLMSDTAEGLKKANITPEDQVAMANAFMLSDRGDGYVDHNNLDGTGNLNKTCYAGNDSQYCNCLHDANQLLQTGVESHACLRYVASPNANLPVSPDNGGESMNYSMKFVDCNQLLNLNYKSGHVPEDLTWGERD